MRTISMVALALSCVPFATAQDEPDFLFGMPKRAVSFRGGYLAASAKGEVFDFFSSTFTIQPSDFNGFVMGMDVAFAVHPRVDVLIGFEYTKGGTESEYIEFEEDDGLPIVQSTELTSFPISGSVKLYLTPRGREISRFAFIPAKTRPYVGAGAGLIWYKLNQFGDFIDFVDLSIFTSQFISTGWDTEAHVFGGLDLQVGRKVYLSFEGRYLWASAALNDPFLFEEPIDLSGLRITAGLNLTF